MFRYIFILSLLSIISLNIQAQYCIPPFKTTGSYGIDSVSLGAISKSTGFDEGYLDFSNTDSTVLKRNNKYTLSIRSVDDNAVKVWIDWNQDGLMEERFDNNRELIVYTTTGGGDVDDIEFIVPYDAMLGSTRIRIGGVHEDQYWLPWRHCDSVISGDIEDYKLIITEGDSMNYLTSEAFQHKDCWIAKQGEKKQWILGIKIEVSNTQKPLEVQSLSFTTTGTTNLPDILNARLWFTGLNEGFDTLNQYGNAIVNPGTGFSINDNIRLLPGINYFWLSIDVNATATVGNFIDAQCAQININGINISPLTTSPTGNIVIQDIANQLNVGCNLVPNPSFELFGCCPTGLFNPGDPFINNVYGPFPWLSATKASPDYLNLCNLGTAGIPSNARGYQFPRTGNGYIGLSCFSVHQYGFPSGYIEDYREYITIQLRSTLIKNIKYNVEFFVSRSEESVYAVDRLGAHFSTNPVTDNGLLSDLNLSPQIVSDIGLVLSDTLNWIRISGIYVAAGGERYMTIGNFFNDPNISTLVQTDITKNFGSAFYFIDDVSVVSILEFNSPLEDTTICTIGDSVSFSQNGTAFYNWYAMGNPTTILSTDSFLAVPLDSSRIYVLKGYNNLDSCAIFDTLSVILDTLPLIDAGEDTLLCLNNTLELFASGAHLFNWSPSISLSDPNIPNPLASPVVTTTYYLITTDTFSGCSNFDSLTIYIKSIMLNIGNDTFLCDGEKIVLDAFNASFEDYIWSTNETSSSINVLDSGIYWLEVRDTPCKRSDTIMIGIFCPNIFIPNVFSPNGDGVNDFFRIRGEGITSYFIRIYDRWGNRVFDSKDVNEVWDGKTSNTGVYVYRLEVILIDGSFIEQNGNVTLFR